MRRVRYIFDLRDNTMIEVFSLADLSVTKDQVTAWLKKEEEDVNFLYDGGKKEESIINDNEYIKTFIDSFNFKSDLDFDLNELNMVYFNNNKNISEY